jgi:hypothetical protein
MRPARCGAVFFLAFTVHLLAGIAHRSGYAVLDGRFYQSGLIVRTSARNISTSWNSEFDLPRTKPGTTHRPCLPVLGRRALQLKTCYAISVSASGTFGLAIADDS